MFPAHAGMDRGEIGDYSHNSSVPRTRGDGPGSCRSDRPQGRRVPRTRGDGPDVASPPGPVLFRVPRTRGDGPIPAPIAATGAIVFPAHAGMDRSSA